MGAADAHAHAADCPRHHKQLTGKASTHFGIPPGHPRVRPGVLQACVRRRRPEIAADDLLKPPPAREGKPDLRRRAAELALPLAHEPDGFDSARFAMLVGLFGAP